MTPSDSEGARRIIHRLVSVVGKVEAVELEIDWICCNLKAFFDASGPLPLPAGGLAPKEAVEAIQKKELLERSRELYAAAGARELKLVPMPGGAFELLIDGQHRLKLSPQLGTLLKILISPDGASPDGLVPWKSRREVQDAFRAESGRAVSDHALTQLVWRLRKELARQADLHRDFVRVHPLLGLRFALQQKPGDATAFVTS